MKCLLLVAALTVALSAPVAAEENRVVNEAVIQKLCPNPKMRCKVRDNPGFYKDTDPELYKRITKPEPPDKACVRELQEVFTDMETKQAKRICDPKNKVKPNEYGWVCYVDPEMKIVKEKGHGTRLKQDAICD
jgi:hypothetical protein